MLVSLDELLPQAGGSVFRLVRIAIIRAREINGGSPALIKGRLSSDKPTIIALEEIYQGKISYVKKLKG